jgi:hypothetical protein
MPLCGEFVGAVLIRSTTRWRDASFKEFTSGEPVSRSRRQVVVDGDYVGERFYLCQEARACLRSRAARAT